MKLTLTYNGHEHDCWTSADIWEPWNQFVEACDGRELTVRIRDENGYGITSNLLNRLSEILDNLMFETPQTRLDEMKFRPPEGSFLIELTAEDSDYGEAS